MLQRLEAIHPITRTVVIVILLTAALLSMLLKAERVHLTGTPVVLATVPVDPRSLFQGDYVILGYEISRLRDNLFIEETRSMLSNVYVELKQEGDIWQPVRASTRRIHPESGNVVLLGNWDGNGNIRYGIESFFVPEGQGHILEDIARREHKRLTVRVLVAPDGTALVDNVLIDGNAIFSGSGVRAASTAASVQTHK